MDAEDERPEEDEERPEDDPNHPDSIESKERFFGC
jgi:hypothetical protein